MLLVNNANIAIGFEVLYVHEGISMKLQDSTLVYLAENNILICLHNSQVSYENCCNNFSCRILCQLTWLETAQVK